MSLRVRRAGSDEWVDGPVASAALGRWVGFKLMILIKIHNSLSRLQRKLEEMK